jgi:hypothetical protein
MPLKVNLAHHPLDALCVVIDLGHVFPQDPVGYVLRGGGAAATQELHEHQGLVNVAHAHALVDVLAQALVGGVGGMGGSWPGFLVRAGLLGRGVTGGGTCRGEALTRCHDLHVARALTWSGCFALPNSVLAFARRSNRGLSTCWPVV